METKDNNLFFTDGDQWESFCHTCLKFRHQKDNYKPVDAVSYKPIDEKDKGDYGLDGFTFTGIAYQCYLPEKQYSDKELYEHLYSKIRTDINKLNTYKDKIEPLLNGVKIKTWYFTTPKIIYSTDFHRLCNNYENDLKALNLSFIDIDFKIGFVDLDNLKPETNIFFNSYNDSLNFGTEIPDSQIIEDYKTKTENNYLINNALRKNAKLFPEDGNDYSINIIDKTNYTIEDYLIGEDIKKQWSDILDIEYEKFLKIKSALERIIKSQSTVPFPDRNKKIEEIRKMLVDKLSIEFPKLLNEADKENLASSIIADWIMRCPLDFK